MSSLQIGMAVAVEVSTDALMLEAGLSAFLESTFTAISFQNAVKTA